MPNARVYISDQYCWTIIELADREEVSGMKEGEHVAGNTYTPPSVVDRNAVRSFRLTTFTRRKYSITIRRT